MEFVVQDDIVKREAAAVRHSISAISGDSPAEPRFLGTGVAHILIPT
jgi:hypothetical protein